MKSSSPQDLPNPAKTKERTVHLKNYYYVAELVGAIVPILAGLAALLFPAYFQWTVQGYALSDMIILMFVVGLVDAILLVLHEYTKKDIFFNLNRYLFVLLFILVIVMSGGVNSSLNFLIIFPFIVSVAYLDRRTTRNIGVFLTLLFALIIFTHPANEIDGTLIAKHIFQTILVGVIALYMYRIVVETLRVKYEKEETARRLAELTHIDELKSDFLSVAQHRLRTPLSGVRFALESLGSGPELPEETRTIIAASLDRVKDSITIVNEMLKTAENISGNYVSLAYSAVDLSALLQTVVKELAFVSVKKGNKVRLELAQEVRVEADTEKIYAALVNIVDNACKYTEHGDIAVSLLREADQAVIKVVDNGIGIDPNDMPHVFDRLHRGENALRLEPDESGVGLYVSKKIIEMHGGTIAIESKLNLGTTVTVRLPMKRNIA
ncbi:MAG: ATP-binding protein [Candidatus Paceibacterota bacterium]